MTIPNQFVLVDNMPTILGRIVGNDPIFQANCPAQLRPGLSLICTPLKLPQTRCPNYSRRWTTKEDKALDYMRSIVTLFDKVVTSFPKPPLVAIKHRLLGAAPRSGDGRLLSYWSKTARYTAGDDNNLKQLVKPGQQATNAKIFYRVLQARDIALSPIAT